MPMNTSPEDIERFKTEHAAKMADARKRWADLRKRSRELAKRSK